MGHYRKDARIIDIYSLKYFLVKLQYNADSNMAIFWRTCFLVSSVHMANRRSFLLTELLTHYLSAVFTAEIYGY